jgi:hypothetical protein
MLVYEKPEQKKVASDEAWKKATWVAFFIDFKKSLLILIIRLENQLLFDFSSQYK